MTARGVSWLLIASVCLLGCGEDGIETTNAPNAGASGVAPQAQPAQAKAGNKGKAKGKGKGKPQAEEEDYKLPPVTFTDSDFIESEESRDPFRDFKHLFIQKTDDPGRVQRRVKASQYALADLKLQAIISRRIMLTDPTGHGWIVYNGDYVGKPELVSSGGADGAEVAINWRVDRIRATDVVFIREDASHPEIPPTTRVVPLYPAGEGS